MPLEVMEPPQDSPLKIARFSDFGSGLRNLGEQWNFMEGDQRLNHGEGSPPPPIALGLELGCGSSHNRPNGFVKSCHGFTVFQLQELQLQSLIYKYMEAGLPVPHHLLLPIWKSLAGSLGGIHGSPFQLYSRSLGFGSLHLDPEPGRCRRTDGKKWRCSKEAVPDHKYCERHMHRGRQRSRKLVEPNSQAAASLINNNTNTNLSIALQMDNSSSASSGSGSGGSNLSSGFISFTPKSVWLGTNLKAETSLQYQGLLQKKT